MTSEFWVTLIAMLAGLVAAVTGIDIDAETLASVWGLPASYVFSRGMAKIKTPSGG